MKNLNRWFDFPESELKKITKDNYYNVELKHNIELTLDNVKEFFYDFECNPNYMESRLKDFRKLNIPNETIISWTTEYYKEDVKQYDLLSLQEKVRYISKLSGILDQFTDDFIVDMTKKLIQLIAEPDFNNKDKRNIDSREGEIFLFYYQKMMKNDELFEGFLPKLCRINQLELLSILINKFVDMIISYPQNYNPYGMYSKSYYYEILTKFNHKFDLDFETIIEKLK